MNQKIQEKWVAKDPEIEKNLRIFTSKIKPVPENIIIANYSGVLTCYDLLFNEAWHPLNKTVIIIQPFWLDFVHETRLDSLWGQNFREFPLTISRLILAMDPQTRNQERLTFRQVRDLRRVCINILKENRHFKVIEGKCESLQLMREKVKREISHLPIAVFRTSIKPLNRLSEARPYNQIEYVKIAMENRKDYLYEMHFENKIYNFSQQSIRDKSALLLPSDMELYQLPKGQEPENIIVLGGGLSALWVMEQAPQSRVRVALRNALSKIAPIISRNRDNVILREKCLFLDQCLLSNVLNLESTPHDSGNRIASPAKNDLVVRDKQSGEILATGSGYSAYGFSADQALTAALPEGMVLFPDKLIDAKTFYAPKNIPFNAFFGRHEAEKRLLMQGKFRVEDINLHALVIREEDKPILALALDTDIRFIAYLCESISSKRDSQDGLEDSPEDTPQFIREVYWSWITKNKLPDNSASFNVRLDNLFTRMEARIRKNFQENQIRTRGLAFPQ